MKTFLKNYTSDVPVSQTIYRIEQVLIRCGVSGITKEYGAQKNGETEVVAIRFSIKPGVESRELTVRLPADKERALDALWLDYANGEQLTENGERLARSRRKKLCRKDFTAQAERTAWRIVQDWVEVQMSMIQLKQAETLEVFLPYVWDGKQTFFQLVKESGFKQLKEKNE